MEHTPCRFRDDQSGEDMLRLFLRYCRPLMPVNLPGFGRISKGECSESLRLAGS